ncbi:aldose 1-epimerase family protein [Dactylosporangium sp. AC04546]|uniref:aldose 1-epimerase family protein n=1 Tax=Dactylosporangium sp. AC04546 TaxID=2862460 RepID=UPI001EDF17FB|nr:aldose 1-epimerase family protein [Dactylosporangium sp. AC04546]WVK83436.1 aldose 1-epimerase family protein [Dactylosporangium sp. AC04546]
MDTAAAQRSLAPSGTQWTIASGGHEAVIVEVGGGVRSYTVDGGDVVAGYAEHERAVGSAGHVLAPWPNRIRDGQYAFGGEHFQLPLTEPERHNAIHGLVNWARWSLVDATAESVTLEHDLVPQPGYPWPLRLRTTWSVGDGGLRATHQATNMGDTAAPFGLATHPYVVVPGVAVDDLHLRVPARTRVLVDGRLLPIGGGPVAGTEYDFTEGRRLGTTVLDTAFGEVDADADGGTQVVVTAPDGRGVAVWADASFTWWQVYSSDTLPADRFRKALAIEPMTCPPDAFRSGRDVVTLEPGSSWQGSWGIRRI